PRPELAAVGVAGKLKVEAGGFGSGRRAGRMRGRSGTLATIVLAISRWVPIASIPEAVRVLSRNSRKLSFGVSHQTSP
ncbi:MAG: hypothetical protein M3R21_04660, partial [Candidatus Dormibacteraeota bacterium]|nr:hypothetical protein [Candidatus Dormibacteraeota bacterium]